jgi:signal recognition particle receptor subunit beta
MSRKRPRSNNTEYAMASALDKLAAYEEFCKDILPSLQKAIKEGRSAEDIYKMAESIAAARAVTIAATEQDSGKALAAIKDIMDRTQGKAKERVETTHKYEKLKDEELDALLLSQGAELDSDEPEAH